MKAAILLLVFCTMTCAAQKVWVGKMYGNTNCATAHMTRNCSLALENSELGERAKDAIDCPLCAKKTFDTERYEPKAVTGVPKISEGMTEAEVFKMAGPGEKVSHIGNSDTYRWNTKEYLLQVQFENHIVKSFQMYEN